MPRYDAFDAGHRRDHVHYVMQESQLLAKHYPTVDRDMLLVAAAYHDLGMSGPRAIHHLTGGKLLAADSRLRKWFSPEQIKIMKEAIEDHRASASHAPRSIYGKIVAEADRDIDKDIVVKRTIQYGQSHYPELDKEQQWQRFKKHMDEKYSYNGYIRLWIPGSPNEQKLKELRDIIANEQRLRALFEQHFQD